MYMDPERDQLARHDGMSTRPTRITDVATAADVSVSTVSNVLNQPHTVRPEARKVVTDVMRLLDYVPNEHAVALRRRTAEKLPSNVRQQTELPADAGYELQDRPDCLPAKERLALSWDKLRPGDRVHVTRSGYPEGEAVVDSMMPDFSALWLRMFNGMGRFIVLPEDDVRFESSGREGPDV
jgi:hypothetical protein